MKKPQFSLTTVFLVVALLAVLLGWWTDHLYLVQFISENLPEYKDSFSN